MNKCSYCGTPTYLWRGSVHGFACRPCIDKRIGLDGPVVVHSTESQR